MSVRKERVDVLLVERGLFETREKAKAAVMAGLVQVAGERCDKPGTKVAEDVAITVKGDVHPYVSRGGLKLEKALRVFDIDLRGKVMMDIGASTGGFTDCALQNGAKHCYALDVGSNQLAWKLRKDERVTVMEKTNFRYSKPEDFSKGLPEFATIDVSFISLSLILPVLYNILLPDGDVVALVKPQFEVEKGEVGEGGIVTDTAKHREVIEKINLFAEKTGLKFLQITDSPIRGAKGNKEFLALYENRSDSF